MTSSNEAPSATPNASTGRRRVSGLAVVAAASVAVLIVLLLSNATQQRVSSDTLTLAHGARVAVDCVEDGSFDGCGRVSKTRFTEVGPYPLLQYLPAVALVKLGRTDDQIVHDLARLSAVAFLASLVLVYVMGRRALQIAWGYLLVVVMLTGPLLWYSRNSLGEMFATAVVLAFMACVVLRAPPVLVAVSLGLAATTKETAVPLLLVLGLVCARDAEDGWLPARRWTLALFGGAAIGMVLNVGFNVFRFGELTNALYLDPTFATPGVGLKARFFVSLWAAPNGGLLWFWMSACLVFVAGGIVMIRQLRARRDLTGWLPTAVVLGLAVVNAAGLASWYAPFGWVAWGPRLSLPLTAAFVVAIVVVGGSALSALAGRVLRSTSGFLVCAVAVVVFAVPQVGVVWNPGAEAALGTLDKACPVVPVVQIDATYYYGCIQHLAWRTKPLHLWEAARTGSLPARLAELALAVAVVSLLLMARRLLLPRNQRPCALENRSDPSDAEPRATV
jgi:hypothetical protein